MTEPSKICLAKDLPMAVLSLVVRSLNPLGSFQKQVDWRTWQYPVLHHWVNDTCHRLHQPEPKICSKTFIRCIQHFGKHIWFGVCYHCLGKRSVSSYGRQRYLLEKNRIKDMLEMLFIGFYPLRYIHSNRVSIMPNARNIVGLTIFIRPTTTEN